MKDEKYTIKSSKLAGWTPIERLIKARGIVGKTAIRNFIKQELKDDEEWNKRMAKAMKGFVDYDQDLRGKPDVPVFDIVDPRWQDTYIE